MSNHESQWLLRLDLSGTQSTWPCVKRSGWLYRIGWVGPATRLWLASLSRIESTSNAYIYHMIVARM